MEDPVQPLPRAGVEGEIGVVAWSAFLRTHAAVVRRLEAEVEARTGLALSWYDVLLELDAAEGGRLRMQELAARVVLSRTRVSRLVEEIARAGFVVKVPDPTDGRATFTRITDEGREQLRRAAPAYLDGIREHFARHLSDDDLVVIAAGLERVLSAHRDASAGGSP